MHSEEDSKTYFYCEMCPDEERYKTTEKGNLARHILAHRTLDEVCFYAETPANQLLVFAGGSFRVPQVLLHGQVEERLENPPD